MLVLVRSNAIVGDPRVEKYVHFLESEKREFRIIGWNRTHDKNIAEDTIYYDNDGETNESSKPHSYASVRGILRFAI